MIKTTRIKYTQSPRIVVDDLSLQCDGVRQHFILNEEVPEYAPVCLIFNGQLYTNTSLKTWFVLDANRKGITTSFPEPPTRGEDKGLILIIGAAGQEDIHITWDDVVVSEIKEWDEETLNSAKEYADDQDALTLAAAKAYADDAADAAETAAIAAAATHTDTATANVLDTAKAYADSVASGATGDAESYTDSAVANAVSTANSYTDTAIGNLATVATTGDYDDLVDTPNLATVATSGSYNDLEDTPQLATVATSGDYTDLSNQPTIPNITLTDTDPGEGGSLAADNYIFVYQGSN